MGDGRPPSPTPSRPYDLGSATPACPSAPRLSVASTLEQLLARQPNPNRTLRECWNLAVAGVGSSTLTSLMTQAKGALASNTTRVGWRDAAWARYPGVHHKHMVRVQHLHGVGARCVVMTLRDPAARLATAFEWERLHRHEHRASFLYQSSRQGKVAGQFALSMQQPNHSLHQYYLSVWNTSRSNPPWGGLHGRETMYGFNSFTVPQIDWLAGLTASSYADVDVHFICLEHYTSDWQRFLSHFEQELHDAGSAESMLHSSVVHKNPSLQQYPDASAVGAANVTATRKPRPDGYRNEGERNYVRECLFPEDTRLWQFACKRGDSADALPKLL